jgi:hypothetical protein
MSTFDFLARYGAERFLPPVNDSVAAVHAWFNSALAKPGGKSSRITDTWMIVSARGVVYGEPVPRDTLDRRHAVKSAVAPARVKVRFVHDKVLALASAASSLR